MSGFRIYRTNVNDLFGAPRGWLAHQGQMPLWVPSETLGSKDVYTESEAETLVHDWNEYFATKGSDLRAHMEKAE